MYQHLTKLLPAGAVALVLLALGFTLIPSPASADCPHNGNENHRHCTGGGGGGEDVQTLDSLSCTTDQIARYDGAAWICSDAVTDLQAQVDDLLFLASGGRFVFVSSSTHQGDFGGVAEADIICNDLAATAGLPGLYKAWLADSDAGSAPASTFFQAPGPYKLPDGTQVANDWADLTDGTLINAINVDENGSGGISSLVWTNVESDGTIFTPADSGHCVEWTQVGEVFAVSGEVGSSEFNNANWTQGQTEGCISSLRLYCFGQ